MLRLEYLEDHTDVAVNGLTGKKYPNAAQAVQEALSLNTRRKELIRSVEETRAELNRASKEIGALMAQGKRDEAEAAKLLVAQLKQRQPESEHALATVEEHLHTLLATLPNVPHSSVPFGTTPDDNPVTNTSTRFPAHQKLFEGAQPHWDIAARLKLIDFETGAKVAGAGFPFYTGQGARLQRALINFFLDRATAAGYLEVQPPLVVNAASGFGTGQLPDKDGQMYYITEDELFLIPTAEVPVTNMFRDVIVDEAELPIRRCAYSACFRREAGSYGAHVRGLNRLHQFDKVEIVQIAHPERSYDLLEDMRTYVGTLLEELELPWRTILLCTGDMGFASAKTYDFEVWSAAQERWLEVSSVSNFEGFQAHRMKCRYRPTQGGPNQTCHTLNGSALALPRIVATLLEAHQQPDGTVRVPAALVPYTGFERIG
jgi:seryl-tRNA synthetase